MLPPCVGNLKLHIQHNNFLSYIYRHANELLLNLPSIEEHRWNSQGGTIWMSECMPADYAQYVLREIEDEEEEEKDDSDQDDPDDEDDYDIDENNFET